MYVVMDRKLSEKAELVEEASSALLVNGVFDGPLLIGL
jgi:hypothetical protein